MKRITFFMFISLAFLINIIDLNANIPSLKHSSTYLPHSSLEFSFANEPIDVVIPCHPIDSEILNLTVNGIRKYGKNIRHIYIISSQPIMNDQAIWFDEARFPFTKEDIALEIFNGDQKKSLAFLKSPKTRIG